MTMSLTRSFDAGAGAEKMSVSARDEIRYHQKFLRVVANNNADEKRRTRSGNTENRLIFVRFPFDVHQRGLIMGCVTFNRGFTAMWHESLLMFFFVGFPCTRMHKELLRVKRLVDLLIRFDVPFGSKS